MGSKSKIEWTDATWNPVTGCTKVSQGCKNCYAETWANRKMGNFSGDRKFTDIICHEDRLEIPKKWAKPRKIFVNSMSDLFHEKVPFEFIKKVMDVTFIANRHIFQILTKRPERMKEFFKWYGEEYGGDCEKNVWLGVSVEDQKTADERIPILLQVPAAVRWISAEPLLRDIDFTRIKEDENSYKDSLGGKHLMVRDWGGETMDFNKSKLNWIVVGGESGPNARPMHPDWVRKIRDDCKAADVPFFFKQWGEYIPIEQTNSISQDQTFKGLFYKESIQGIERIGYYEKFNFDSWNKIYTDETIKIGFSKLGKHMSGNLLDEKQYLEFPK